MQNFTGKDQAVGPPAAFLGRPVSPFAVAPPPQARPPPPSGLSPQTAMPGAAPVSFSGPSPAALPPSPYETPSQAGNFPRFPAPQQFPRTVPQVGFSQRGPHSIPQQVPGPPPIAQPLFPAPPPLGSRFPTTQSLVGGQAPPVPMGSTPQSGNIPHPQMGGNMLPPSRPFAGYGAVPPSSMDSSYSPPRPFMQQSFQPNPNVQGHYSFNTQQGVSLPPPPVAPSVGFSSREQSTYPSSGPPIGGALQLQGLVEDFQSLSVKSAPGSVDPGIDFYSLPRPMGNEFEPRNLIETYPLNCHSRYFRLTTHALPNSQSLLARWHLPLGAVVHPLAESPDGEDVPIVNFGPIGVIRCRRCRTYINPYAAFTDAGRKWRCNLCSLLNDVPAEYFCILDASGRRCDLDQRPELTKGSVEFVAPTEYMVRPPMPPTYFFLIDVSISAVRSGMIEVVAKTIKSCLDELSANPRTQIGFLTFDSTLHFYNLKSSLMQPQMLVVADLDDIFVPLPDDLLVNLSDSRSVVDAFLDSVPSAFHDNINVESALGPALKAAFMVMNKLGGKLLVFQTTLPSLGVGHLKLRGDNLHIYGTDKEHTIRIPEDPFYKQMAAEFTKYQVAVDMFVSSDKYCDVASLGSLAKYTGGQIYYYPSFLASLHQERLKYDLARDLTRETAWESVLRVRCGKGVRFTTYHGNFMLRSTDLMALPAVDCDKAFAMQLSLEDTLVTTQTLYFQVALLYTSSSGERRIRVHTAAAPVVTDLSEMYRQADTGASVSLMSRLAIEKTLSHKLEDARNSVQMRITKSFKEYRNLYVVQHRLGGRLIFPESLQFLPLYGLALCKSLALRGGYADALLDERCAAGYTMMILPVKRMMKLLYPNLIKLDESILKSTKNTNEFDHLKPLPLTASSLDPRGLYLYDDGFRFVIWFGRLLQPDVTSNILGDDLHNFRDLSEVVLAEHNNEVSRNLMKILKQLRENESSCHKLFQLIRQGEQPRESALLLNSLIEDQVAGTSGYLGWILDLYRQTLPNS